MAEEDDDVSVVDEEDWASELLEVAHSVPGQQKSFQSKEELETVILELDRSATEEEEISSAELDDAALDTGKLVSEEDEDCSSPLEGPLLLSEPQATKRAMGKAITTWRNRRAGFMEASAMGVKTEPNIYGDVSNRLQNFGNTGAGGGPNLRTWQNKDIAQKVDRRELGQRNRGNRRPRGGIFPLQTA